MINSLQDTFLGFDSLHLVDIITVVTACVLAKALEVQFQLTGHPRGDTLGLDLGCQHLAHVQKIPADYPQLPPLQSITNKLQGDGFSSTNQGEYLEDFFLI